MPDLLIRVKKKSDGSAALTCTRADGSVTWQRQDGKLGAFFPLHDLTHYAVETVFGFRRAFYGLLAEGWDLSSFGEPGTKGRLPEDANLAELIVGFFDLERITGNTASADEFNDKIRDYLADNKFPPTRFRVDDGQLENIRRFRDDLFARWRAVPAGETLELPFDRDSTVAA
jgi:hypothetical protein